MHRLPILYLLILLVFLLLAAPSGAAAQEPVPHGRLSGVVTNVDGHPLPGASVVLWDEGSGLQRYGTATGTEGDFAFPQVRPGTYRFVVSHLGFAAHAEKVRVDANGQVVRTVVLAATTVPQEAVVVVGARARRQLNPITLSNMTARDLERQPAMKDLPVLLSSLPSLTYHSENGNGIGYSTLRMRGFDQRRIAVSINGIPQNDPEDFNVFWINFFDIQGAVGDVQVQRGAGSALYGTTAIGGAINVSALPYRARPYAFAEAGYGSFDTQRYTVEANSGLLNDRYVLFGRFSRLLSDGYRDWSWSRFYRFFVGGVRYGTRSTLTVQAYGGPQEDGLAFSGIPKDANEGAVTDAGGTSIDRRYNPSSLTRDVEHFHQPHLEILHDFRFSEKVSVHQALFGVKGEGYFEFGGTYRSADYLRLPEGWRDLSPAERTLPLFLSAPDAAVLFRAYLDQWQVGWLPRLTFHGRNGETTIGAEARLHRSARWGRIQEGSGVPEEVIGGTNDHRAYQFHGEKVITSLFGSHLMRMGERLALQADLQLTYRRYRHHSESFFGRRFDVPYLFANPRLGITINPERPLSMYASVALASREPRLKSLYDGEEAGAGFLPRFETDEGTVDYNRPLVRPERLLDVEMGSAWTRDRYRLAANVYWMEFWDEIVPSGGLDQFGVPRSGNAERTRHMGLELEGAVRLAAGLDLQANATLSRNRFIAFEEYVSLTEGTTAVSRDGNPIAGFPERIATAALSYEWRGVGLHVSSRFTGQQYVDNSGATRPDGANDAGLVVDRSILVDAGARYRFGARSPLRGLEAALDMNNVLNDRVLLYGNVGPLGPQFFPMATRHVFLRVRYRVQ